MLTRFVLITALLLSICGFSKENISVTAESAVLMDPVTKKVIYSKNIHAKRPPASTAKVMTALLVLKESSLNKKVAVSSYASSMEPSKIYIKEGELFFTEDLIKAALLNSGNDASVALAESAAGTEQDFSSKMTELAHSIGAKNTRFKNPNGLPKKGQYSTAYDLALIIREAMKYKDFVDILKLKTASIKEINTDREIKLKNHNKTLWKEKPYLIFGKTGYTKNAGHCFAGYIQYNRWKKVIVVILKSSKMWQDLDALAVIGDR